MVKKKPDANTGSAELVVLEALRAKFGRAAAITLAEEDALSEVKESIPTGIDVVDHYVIGCGGLPVKRLIEVYGGEGSGKSSFVLQCLGQVQKMGGIGILAETEGAVSAERAAVFGCDLNRLIILQPDTLEDVAIQIVEAVRAVPKNAGPVLAVWDSIAASMTKREIDEGLEGTAKVGERARQLSNTCRHFTDLMKKHRVAILCVNQIRDNIGVMFGDKTVTPGGHAVKFLAGVRLQILGGAAVKDGVEHEGKDVTYIAAKNKVAPPWRKARVRLNYAEGFDNIWSTLSMAMDRKLIPDRSKGMKAYLKACEALGWTSRLEEVPL